MSELARLTRRLRCEISDPLRALEHRLRIGLAVALLLFLVSLLR